MNPKISVAITLYNEEKNIERLIENLNNQDFRDFEVILVDDGSTDNTLKELELHKLKVPFQIFPRKHQGLRPARTFGAEKSNGEIIVTIDADEGFDSKLLSTLYSHFKDPSIGAIGGFIKPVGNKWYHAGFSEIFLWSFQLRKVNPDYVYVYGGCAAYRKKALDEIGGLPKGIIGEDVEASWEIKNKGWKVILDENIQVFHYEKKPFIKYFKRIVADQNTQTVVYEKYKTKRQHLIKFIITHVIPHRVQSGTLETLYAYFMILIFIIFTAIQYIGILIGIMDRNS
ncbi:MAG: glycosyltransferase [Candidatus Ranarchaeia archaeon]